MIPAEKVATRRIDGPNVVLLPYTAALVPTYHAWMQDPELLALTESEPLTLAQEYANQESWSVDPTKYCFIVHSRRPVITTFRDGPGVQTQFGIDYTLESEEHARKMKEPVHVQDDNEEKGEEADEDAEEIVVDGPEESPVTRFDTTASPTAASKLESLTTISPGLPSTSLPEASASPSLETPSDAAAAPAAASTPSASSAAAPSASDSVPASSSAPDVDSVADSSASSISTVPEGRYPLTPIGDVNLFLYDDFNLQDYGINGGGCEVEVMVAQKQYRRRGLAFEAVKLILQFSAEQLGVERFVAKILASNEASRHLFEHKLGFRVVEYVECFDEIVLFRDTSSSGIERFGATLQEGEGEGEAGEQGDEDSEEKSVATQTSAISRMHLQETVTAAPGHSTTQQSRVINDLD